jgi:hypothetical protein
MRRYIRNRRNLPLVPGHVFLFPREKQPPAFVVESLRRFALGCSLLPSGLPQSAA